MKSLPTRGIAWPALKVQLAERKRDDFPWRKGRLPLYVYWRDEELEHVAKDAYAMYFAENGLGQRAFPSLRLLEEEVVEMGLSILQGGSNSAGSLTSGGTESIFQAVKTARDRARAERPRIQTPKIVVPVSAHPAFNKAGHYLDVRVERVAVREDFRVDVGEVARAIDDDTIMIVGSAPCFPYGVIDPIGELGQLAQARGLWLHVDACVGGMLAPFVRKLGYPVAPFELSVSGVTSLSVDLHKYGYAAKGASLILYRDGASKAFQRFEFRDWPRGLYATDTFSGTRPGGAIAAAWAVMNFLGESGYVEAARKIMNTKARIAKGIGEIDGLGVVEPNELSFLLYRSVSPEVDINNVADAMGRRGWFVGRSLVPPAIHLMLNPVHEPVADEYLDDLAASVAEARHATHAGVADERTY